MTQSTSPRFILVLGPKGGAGRSCITAAVALRLAESGFAPGLLDLDFAYPAQAAFLSADGRPTVARRRMEPPRHHGIALFSSALFFHETDLLTWTGPTLQGALHQALHDVNWYGCDLVLVDVPPGHGEVHVRLLDMFARTEILLVSDGRSAGAVSRDLLFLKRADRQALAHIINRTTKSDTSAIALPEISHEDGAQNSAGDDADPGACPPPRRFLQNPHYREGIDRIVSRIMQAS